MTTTTTMMMKKEILVADNVTKLFLRSCHNLSITDSCADQLSSSSSPYRRFLQISALILPVDAVAPPPVKPTTYRIPRRTLLRRKRRTKRGLSGDDSGDEDEGFYFCDGSGGPFGGGGGGGFGGSGWNFNRYGDDSSSSLPDPAFDFVYQVLSWIMLSNCLHYAFKKILRIVVDADRGKVPRRLAPLC